MKIILTTAAFLLLSFGQKPMADEVLIDRIVAVVNNDVILQSELDRETVSLQRQAAESGQRLPRQEVLLQRILERLIQNKVQLQRADALGITVDEDTLNRTITSIARNNNMDLSAFRQVLRREGIDYQVFRNNIREELTISRLRNREIDSKVTVSPREIDAYLKRNEDDQIQRSNYKLQHILIGVPEGANAEQIQQARTKITEIQTALDAGEDFAQLAATHSDGARALDGGSIGWRRSQELPELFAEAIETLGPGQITPPLRSPNGFHLLKVQQIKDAETFIATETRTRHILLKDSDSGNDDASRAKLQQIRQRIIEGESFSELAKSLSEDKSSAASGGELPWYRPGEMVSEFEKVAANTPLGQISEPFRTSFGWHIVEPLERRNYNPTIESRRSEAENTLRKTRADTEYDLWLRRLRSEAYVEIRKAG